MGKSRKNGKIKNEKRKKNKKYGSSPFSMDKMIFNSRPYWFL